MLFCFKIKSSKDSVAGFGDGFRHEMKDRIHPIFSNNTIPSSIKFEFGRCVLEKKKKKIKKKKKKNIDIKKFINNL